VIAFTKRALRYWRRNRRYWSLAKLANAAVAQAAMHLRMTYNPAMPVVAKIEATNICNGTCRLCPVGRRQEGRRPLGMMNWDGYCRLIDRVARWAHTVDLTNWGESLLHPRIADMVAYAHRAGLYTYLSTNLHTLGPGQIDALMTCGLDELTLSLHGLSKATYAAYQPGFDFDDACRMIDALLDARRRLGRLEQLKITLNFVVTAINEHEVGQVESFARQRGLDWALSEASLNLRFLVGPQMAQDEPQAARQIVAGQADQWLPKDPTYVRPLYERARREPSVIHSGRKLVWCDWPWTKLVVNWDGALSACCGSFAPGDDVGHDTGQPLRQLWNSPGLRACRASFRRRQRPSHADVLCGRCPGVLL
jgi:MoaA/NifB/PqqE/SkfB family radical SAM enzyme